MDFFNKLTKKAKETYKEASQKTGELAKEAKLRMKMNENKSTINSLYQEIGKKVYEKHVKSESIDIKTELEEECTKIDVLSAEIETCLKQIRELKDKKQCPKCFKEIELDDKFCNYCGAKQEDTEAKEAEVLYIPNTQNNEDANQNSDVGTDTTVDESLDTTVTEEKNESINNEVQNQEANNNEDN
jgi:hypothetical protein